jgi:hypothetical protein
MMYAELEGIICSGARTGRQFTYALLDEVVPAAKTLSRVEALSEFTRRYFTTRGPATLKDFTAWSGLTMKDAKEGLAALPKGFIHENINGQEYVFLPSGTNIDKASFYNTFLIPDYDEYVMSYKDRSNVFLPSGNTAINKGDNAPSQHMVVINGVIGGTWKRTIRDKQVAIETTTFKCLHQEDERALKKAVDRYCSFFGIAL